MKALPIPFGLRYVAGKLPSRGKVSKMKMRPVILFLSIVLFSVSAQAQLKGFSLGPYAEMAWPTGSFATTHDRGLGAGFGADIKLPGSFGVSGSAGVLRFGGKTVTSPDGHTTDYGTINAVPIRAGIKYRLPLLYLKVEGGTARIQGEESNPFILAPGVGFRLLGVDVQGKYETWIGDTKRSFWGVKASYNF